MKVLELKFSFDFQLIRNGQRQVQHSSSFHWLDFWCLGGD